jgi:hypothetical protein
MDWLKNNGITLLILIFLGFLVLKSLLPSRNDGIDYNVQKQLDSAKALIVEKSTENKFLLKEKDAVEKEKLEIISNIKDQLMQIQPKYIKIMTDFNKASPEQRKKFVYEEYNRRKKEMENDSKDVKKK